jgi:TetR/AcrR family transcriptional repressor of nem operon
MKIGKFLEDAQKREELPASLDINGTADFILSSWQGAIMQMKVTRDTTPLRNFDKMIFESLLRQ